MDNARDKIIMVDDDIINLTVGKNSLSEDYDVFTVPSGKKLFELLEKVTPSLILLDIEMPEMDGFEIIRELKKSSRTTYIPVIFLTAVIDPEIEVKGLSLGAVDYITKPFSHELLNKRVNLHILFEKQKKELLTYNLDLEGEVSKKTKAVFELQNAILQTVAELVECRDSVTGGHIERTQRYLRMLVDFLIEHGIYTELLNSWDLSLFILSSQLHDVGKISIKDSILMKPGELTAEEYEEMKKHTLFGVEIIRNIEDKTEENEFLSYAEILAGSHHEKWDGSGYPFGLKDSEIPLHGRLMAIVDVYDALTNDRPYKRAFTHEEAVGIIKEGFGTHFDPEICEVFLEHEKEFNAPIPGYETEGAAFDKFTETERLFPTIKMVANIVDARGGTNGGRAEAIQRYLKTFVEALLESERYADEVKSWDIDLFLISAQLYDVGKIAVHSDILNKDGELTDQEFEDVKNHADFGVKVVREIKERVDNSGLLQHAEALAGSHHEKWDGSGYPQGLKGNGIPLQGRIMAIVDVYEALVNDRPHRVKKPHAEAVEIIRSGSGTHFDPGLVSIFLEHNMEFMDSNERRS